MFGYFYRYTGEGGVSNMAIVEAKMVSGWQPDKDSLEKLKSDSTVELRKYEINPNGAAQLYFDEVRLHGVVFLFSNCADSPSEKTVHIVPIMKYVYRLMHYSFN